MDIYHRSLSTNRRSTILQLAGILTLLLLGSGMVYGLNTQVSRSAYYLLVSVFFLATSNNIFAISLLFIIILNPWGLFFYRPYEWFIPLTATVGISYKYILGFLVFLKFILNTSLRKNTVPDFILKHFRPLAFYLVFLVIWGIVFGISNKSIYDLILASSSFLLFTALIRTFNRESIIQFNRLLFAFSILHSLISILDIMSEGTILRLLTFGRQVSTASVFEDQLIRLTGGIGISLYTLITALYYLVRKEGFFRSWYLWLTTISAYFYILNSATRGWMMAIFFIAIFYLLYYYRNILFNLRILISAITICLIVIIFLPNTIIKNLNASFERFSTVESLAEGDLTVGGTAGRWEIRGPMVLTRFKESPVFGFGFSKVTSDYYDGHVGNHSLLLMGGIIGLLVIWITVLFMVVLFLRLEQRGAVFSGSFIYGIALLSIMIIHSTSRSMVSFQLPIDSAFIISLFMNQVNINMHQFNTSGERMNIERK